MKYADHTNLSHSSLVLTLWQRKLLWCFITIPKYTAADNTHFKVLLHFCVWCQAFVLHGFPVWAREQSPSGVFCPRSLEFNSQFTKCSRNTWMSHMCLFVLFYYSIVYVCVCVYVTSPEMINLAVTQAFLMTGCSWRAGWSAEFPEFPD